MNRFSISAVLFGAVIVASVPFTAFALLDRVHGVAQRNVDHIRKNIEAIRENANISEEVQAKRQEIEARITEKRNAVTDKLTGKRASACKEKEAKINHILTERTETAQRYFDTFKRIQDRLSSFVAENELSVENAQALQIILIQSEIDAQAAIDAAKASPFSCDTTDASSPGRIATEQVAAQKTALKAYRAALKDYAAAIKAAATDRANTETTTEAARE